MAARTLLLKLHERGVITLFDRSVERVEIGVENRADEAAVSRLCGTHALILTTMG